MVNLLVDGDEDALSDPGGSATLFDPACGTGGMLSVAEAHIKALNPDAQVEVFGQELNAESYAICLADMMSKGQDASHIVFGNCLSEDGHAGERFDYLLANPPFGVEWKKVDERRARRAQRSRFRRTLRCRAAAQINDGQLLFLQHMISKMQPA